MANQEQEINQQPDTNNQVNGELAVNTPEDTTTQPTSAVEDTETTSESAPVQ